jgi:hypothetical protein
MSERHCNEKWKDVKGFENYYQVSHRGRVKSLARVVPMSDGRTYRVAEKILKSSWDGHYFHVILSKSGKEYVRLVHRLVAEAFIGECPDGMECCHEDGDSTFNHVSNLRWDTPTGNQQDRIKHGTSNHGKLSGEAHPMVKIKTDDVLFIRRQFPKTHKGRERLAERFGVSEATIRDILKRRSWQHI